MTAKTVPVPTRVHLIGETAVIVGTPGRGWDEDAHNCDAMGCATIGPHVLARVPFTDERAMSQAAEAQAQGGREINMDVTVRDGAWVGTYAEWCRRNRKAPPIAHVGVDVSDLCRKARARFSPSAHPHSVADWIEQQALAQQPAAAGEEPSKGADVAQPKRRPYNASGSLSEYGVFPECDVQQPADARRLVAKLAAHVRPTCSELWDEAQAFLAALAQQPAATRVRCGDERYELDAYLWRRESTQEWVLELSGAINNTSFTNRFPVPLSYAPEDAVSLPNYAPQPAAVDEAMVERATTAYLQSRGTYEGEVPVDRNDIRAALIAALTGEHNGQG